MKEGRPISALNISIWAFCVKVKIHKIPIWTKDISLPIHFFQNLDDSANHHISKLGLTRLDREHVEYVLALFAMVLWVGSLYRSINISKLGRYYADAASIDPVLGRFWHITACLQRYRMSRVTGRWRLLFTSSKPIFVSYFLFRLLCPLYTSIISITQVKSGEVDSRVFVS